MKANSAWRGFSTALLLTLLAPLAAAQVTLRVTAPDSAIVGTSFAVQVSAEGLGDALALGGYDVDLVLDSMLVSFVSLAFGDAGGHSALDGGFGSTFQSFTPETDRVAVSEFSLDSEANLLAAQPGSFVLFTVQVAATSSGSWLADLDTITLADQSGNALTPTVVNTGVTIVPVPEPTALALVTAGLAGVLLRVRRARRRR